MGVLILKVPSNLFYQTYCLSGNSKFLIRRNYHYSGLTVRSGNRDLLAALVVRILINGYAQEAQMLAYQGTNQRCVLTDTCGKADHIYTCLLYTSPSPRD